MRKIAMPGDVVTCENGHEVCTVAHQIVGASTIAISLFTDWRDGQQPPRTGERIAPCHCGAKYIRATPYGYELHGKEGWR